MGRMDYMKRIYKKSAGCFVLVKQGSVHYILLQRKCWNEDNMGWVPPKGGLEGKESPKEAAVREIYEETGVKNIHILCDLGKTQYCYPENGITVEKEVYWFLATTPNARLHPNKLTVNELSTQKEVRWIPIQKAYDLMMFKTERKLLQKLVPSLSTYSLLDVSSLDIRGNHAV